MKKILQGAQVKELDAKHISISGQSSQELMEVAALGFVDWYVAQDQFKEFGVLIFVGAGNNGGDGLAIARILTNQGVQVSVVLCFTDPSKLSPDASVNWELLPKSIQIIDFKELKYKGDLVLIDCYFGVGLTGSLRESSIPFIDYINEFSGPVVSVDLPSGLPSETIHQGLAVRADFTVTFAFPKLSLLLPENAEYVGELVLVDIGIEEGTSKGFDSNFYYLERKDIPALHKSFHRFSYKGDYGKILIAGGSPGKMGALILCAKSALRTGTGLVTCHIEDSERDIIQTAVPEAMASWGLIANLEYYDSVGIGPGWGQDGRVHLLTQILKEFKSPVVIDADGLNILARSKELLELVPKKSILTPHIGEFSRLVGPAKDHLERLEMAKEFSVTHQLILVLKGANTVISLPDGRQIFNSSGTKYMATGGSGDVLTGMITSYLGQGYEPENAAICGVYHHGLAGEITGVKKRKGLIASDLIEAIPETYAQLNIS
ncbi:NAD(P)H-hydrate dehydratase [Algoriphagus lutimaris]|uniref:NAD(P)H-hydrate dehydratase n=1 Tax=Algoriphagus lutimaris TaxID=613197 RepID=UPI00196ABA78|nr:NAD(P)H-hydrate dehydratase [Algoriphagus lutimaris]MBN3522087.1 NAD(P)H-hydrate dehydratase [Algoriphagus lutimaris]